MIKTKLCRKCHQELDVVNFYTKGQSRETPTTLAMRWGIKSSLISKMLRLDGLMESNIQKAASGLRSLRG